MSNQKTEKKGFLTKPQIDELSRRVGDRILDFLDYFGLEYKEKGNHIHMTCPIHEGDKDTSLCVYLEGDESGMGNWKCYSHHCEDKYVQSPLGLIRALMVASGEEGNYGKLLHFCLNFLDTDIKKLKFSDDEIDQRSFVDKVRKMNKTRNVKQGGVTRSQVISKLKQPVGFFLKRGFKEATLKRFDVGVCDQPDKEMHGRAVVPIYDDGHEFMVGCTGRTLHNEKRKWIHSKGLRTQAYLYNYWYAQPYIQETQTIILVEGPVDVWRLHESGINNVLGIFGSALSDEQEIILQSSGAVNIVIIRDADEPGLKAAKQIEKKCERMFNIYHMEPLKSRSDVGDMTVEEINDYLKPQLERNRLWRKNS